MRYTARAHGAYAALIKLGLSAPSQPDAPNLHDVNSAYIGGAGAAASVTGMAGTTFFQNRYRKLQKAEQAANALRELAGQQPPVEDISKALINQFGEKYKPIAVGWNPLSETAHYDMPNNYINAKLTDPATLAHELGHAELQARYPGFSTLAYSASKNIRRIAPATAFGAGTLSEDDHAGTVAGASLLSHIPTLADEAGASYSALKQLKNMNYKGNPGRVLGTALGTYASHALGGIGGDVAVYELGRLARHTGEKAISRYADPRE